MKKLKTTELNRKSIQEFKTGEKLPVVVVLDNIRSAYNTGSIFRTADAFMVHRIILCGISPQPPNRELLKTALGATDSVDWIHKQEISDALNTLKAEGYIICGIEQTNKSTPLSDFLVEPDQKYALVFGNEITGISDIILPLLDHCIEIPQFGTKHSMNVSVTAGIVLYSFSNSLEGK
jgi:23S rRNA (guanosine2251-2'-O)-methyltransferase